MKKFLVCVLMVGLIFIVGCGQKTYYRETVAPVAPVYDYQQPVRYQQAPIIIDGGGTTKEYHKETIIKEVQATQAPQANPKTKVTPRKKVKVKAPIKKVTKPKAPIGKVTKPKAAIPERTNSKSKVNLSKRK